MEVNCEMIKCKKCRKELINEEDVQTSHGCSTRDENNSCPSQVWFVKEEAIMENRLNWIKNQVDLDEWKKGKLLCPHQCGARLGSFNFISIFKCSCKKCLTPPIHIIKKRVDLPSRIILDSSSSTHSYNDYRSISNEGDEDDGDNDDNDDDQLKS